MPISASTDISNHLAGNSVQMLPHVTAEWNYNLVYSPFATYAGTGNGISTIPFNNPANWSKSNNTNISMNILGKTTSSFYDPSAIQIGVVPTADYSNAANYTGSASISLPIGSNVSNCYKMVFYVKSISNSSINLVIQASSNSGQLNGSSFTEVDDLDWVKVELFIGQRPTDISYSSINLNFDLTNNNLSASNAGNWGIIISQPKIFQTTYFDYSYNSLWDTNHIFSWFRPGESYIRSGNNQALDSDVINQRLLKYDSAGGLIPSGWNNAAPCSSVVYSPRILFQTGQNPIFKNGMLSQYSQYKYFVSEAPLGTTSVGATYPELLKINKIVLKFNISQSKPDIIQINLKDSTTNTINSVSINSSSISGAGVCILYWNGATWGTNKWAWSPSLSNMPFINDAGQIAMYVNGTQISGCTNIDSISITQVSSTPIVNLTNNPSIPAGNYNELNRLQVIEISPRLEVDLTNLTLDFDIKKEFDNKNTPLPISSISANSASVSFSNVPLTGLNNYPISIFSSIANDSNYVSPISDLLVKNTKIYLNYYFPTLSNSVIPAGVFYVDSWDNQDIKTIKASCFDAMKILQTMPVYDYVSESQSADKVFSNLLDFSGFTDYNYDELISAISDSKQKIGSNFFFADSASKTIYTALQEAFLAYQIGAWVDEYGVMRFKNLNKILSSNISSFTINDSNILSDSYSENIKTKIGKILMRYRSPQIKRSLTLDSNVSKIISVLQQAPEIIWQQDTEDLVPFNFLKEDINTLSQNFYVIDQGSYNSSFFTNKLDHQGYYIVEDEIISSGAMEILLTGMDNTGKVLSTKLVYPSNSNELTSEIASFSNQTASSNMLNVNQQPTGKFMNVKRGLFGSKSSTHYVMKNDAPGGGSSIYASKFNTISIPINGSSITSIANPTIKNSIINVPIIPGGNKTYVVAKTLDDNYSTYSAKFKFNADVKESWAGIFMGMTGSSSLSGTSYYVEMHKYIDSNNITRYTVKIYSVNSAGTSTQLTKEIDITGYLNADFENEPSDAIFSTEAGRFINLKFVNGSTGNRAIYVNKNRIFLDRFNNNIDQKTGKFLYSSYWIDDTNTSNGAISSSFPKSFSLTNFGFFTYSTNTVTSTTLLSEIYATEAEIDTEQYYYFQTKEYLNAIVAGNNISEKSFFVQSRPQLIGLNMYDVQLAFSPSLGAEVFKVAYSFPYYPNGDTTAPPKIIHVRENALNYSEILSTGFRAKFAIVNNSNYAIYTKTDQSYTQLADSQLLLSSRSPIVLTPQLTIEKVLNPSIINEVIELQSDWIQSKDTADAILKILTQAVDPFSKDISVSIFGNPLVQIGDVINLSYSLKNISNISFFVAGISQTWSNSGLTTLLKLNQIPYAGGIRTSYKKSYPGSSNASLIAAPYISNISPSSGVDSGGTSVTILGSNFGSNPQVIFGNTVANISSSTSTSITVTTPSTYIDSTVDVSIISNGVVNTLTNPSTGAIDGGSFNKFTYTSDPTTIQTVNTITPTTGTIGVNNLYSLNINWTISSDVGKNYNAYNLNIHTNLRDDNSSQVLDNGSHSFTSLSEFQNGETGTIIITPLYIDSLGLIHTGVPSAATSFTISPSSTFGGPSNIQYTTSANSNGTYNVTFTFLQGNKTNSTILFMDGIGGGNRINNGSLIYWTGTTITVKNISNSSHTFYFYGYVTGTSTSNLYPSSPASITVSPPGTPTVTATGPQAPTVTYVATNTRVSTVGQISVVYDVTFTITPGANSNRTYFYMDAPAGGHNLSTLVYNGTSQYWTSNTITITNLTSGQHSFDFFGGDASGVGTGFYNVLTVAANQTPPAGGGSSGGTPPATPVLTASAYPYSGGDLSALVTQDTTVGGYQVFVNGALQNDIPKSQFVTQSSYYVVITSGLNYQVGKTYDITVKAYDVSKTSFSAASNVISITIPTVVPLTFSATTNIINWVVSSNTLYDQYSIALNDINGKLKTYTVRNVSGSWQDVSDGYVLSTDGLTFTDDRIPNGKFNGVFTAGAGFSVSLICNQIGVPPTAPNVISGSILSAYAFALPSAPYIYITGSAGATTFSWNEVSLPSGTAYGYQVELYAGSNTSGTLMTINPISSYYMTADLVNAFTRLKNATGVYSISTGHAYPLYCRVRLVFNDGIIEKVSAWGDNVVLF